MEAATHNNRVLKLVHPGPFIEILKASITAAEVMAKNPRHCITRPDFFKFPWIVVSPDSVLNLGEVFYIVPNRTIYRLQKARSSPDQISSRRRERIYFSEELMKVHCQEQEHGHGRRLFRRRSEGSCSTVKYGRRNSFDNNYHFEENYETRINFFNAKDYYYSKFPEREDKTEVISKRVTEFKSCLRKEDSVRKLMNLKVSFVLPNKCEEKQKRCKESETEFSAGFSICSLLCDDDDDDDDDDELCTRDHVQM